MARRARLGPIAADERTKMVELYRDHGLNIQTIAKLFHCGQDFVSQLIRAANIQIEPRRLELPWPNP